MALTDKDYFLIDGDWINAVTKVPLKVERQIANYHWSKLVPAFIMLGLTGLALWLSSAQPMRDYPITTFVVLVLLLAATATIGLIRAKRISRWLTANGY